MIESLLRLVHFEKLLGIYPSVSAAAKSFQPG